MFIVIEDDTFEGIEDIHSAFDTRIIAIDKLFESMLDGKHIVFCTLENLYKLKKNSLLGERTRWLVAWLTKTFSQSYSCKDILTKYISISSSYNEISFDDEKNCYRVPVDYVCDVMETKLLTEHESDAKFFQQIANYVLSLKSKGHNNFSFRFENDSYHGGNAKSTIEQVSKGKKIVLVIVDSDRDYKGGQRGSTYKSVKDSVKIAKRSIVIDYLELPVREKENLIPSTIYSLFVDSGIVHVIADNYSDDEEINSFFDIKGGIKYKKIVNHNEIWENKYGKVIEICRNAGICKGEVSDEITNLDKYYIDGIGDKICDNVADAIFGNDKYKDVLDNLPTFVMDNWENITKELFTWGCCISKDKYPVNRDFE